MSLFSVCNCWTTQCADLEENYDVSSLLCARFGLSSNEKDYIVVGSHHGYLSVFYPRFEWQERQMSMTTTMAGGNAYNATDLLLEAQFTIPIVGLYAGHFSNARNNSDGDENGNQLAVLHPNSLSIYQLQTLDGIAEHGTQLYLQPLVEHRFDRVAVDLCKGHFGQVKGREFFCVVQIDGSWRFYEQDGISYECDFADYPAQPAPVAYCERTDCFLRFSAAWHLDCFTYQDLAHSALNRSRYQTNWSICIGEGLLDMQVVQARQGYATIMLLGEHNFYALSDTGKMEFTLKLDYVPKCFCTFVVGYYWEPTARLMSAIANDDGRLYVYHDASIVWGAQQSDQQRPVALRRANIHGLPGALVTLNASGQLNIGYLGTEPHHFDLPTLSGAAADLSFGAAYKQLVQLEEEIREAVDTRNTEAINQRAATDVSVQFRLGEATETPDLLLLVVSADVAVKELLACRGTLSLSTKLELQELQIAFSMAAGLRCTRETLSYVDVPADWHDDVQLDFYIDELQHIHSARVECYVSYVCVRSIPRVLRLSEYLPLQMFLRPAVPQKTGSLKLTLTLTAPGLSARLVQFFPEFVSEMASNNETHALGLQLLCPGKEKAPECVTLITAKNSNRLRVQTDNMVALPLVLERLAQISRQHVGNSGAAAMQAMSTSTSILPSQQILHYIDVHHETQENIRAETMHLDTLWTEFKTLQRRLQEQKESDAKETLVMQIEEIYDQLIASGDKLTQMRTDERRHRCDLNCAIAVANDVIAIWPLEERVLKILTSVLTQPVEDWTEMSWEETMAPGIDMLHHYGPLNRVKLNEINTATNAASTTTVTHDKFEYARFRRYLVMLFDRIAHLADNAAVATSQETSTSSTAGITGTGKLSATEEKPRSAIMPLPKYVISQVRQLEVVVDNEDEENAAAANQQTPSSAEATELAQEKCEWLNDDYELLTTEDLFTNLGIWW